MVGCRLRSDVRICRLRVDLHRQVFVRVAGHGQNQGLNKNENNKAAGGAADHSLGIVCRAGATDSHAYRPSRRRARERGTGAASAAAT